LPCRVRACHVHAPLVLLCEDLTPQGMWCRQLGFAMCVHGGSLEDGSHHGDFCLRVPPHHSPTAAHCRTYGATGGLVNATCTGRCVDGVLCEPHSVSATGVPCPTGVYVVRGVTHLHDKVSVEEQQPTTYMKRRQRAYMPDCVHHVSFPCPSGRYNSATGASDVMVSEMRSFLLAAPVRCDDLDLQLFDTQGWGRLCDKTHWRCTRAARHHHPSSLSPSYSPSHVRLHSHWDKCVPTLFFCSPVPCAPRARSIPTMGRLPLLPVVPVRTVRARTLDLPCAGLAC
jgi:hypothetical protein